MGRGRDDFDHLPPRRRRRPEPPPPPGPPARRRGYEYEEEVYNDYPENEYYEDEYYDEEVIEEPPRRQPPQHKPVPSSPAHNRPPGIAGNRRPPKRPRKRRRGSIMPALLMGCAIGVIGAVGIAAAIVFISWNSLRTGELSLPGIRTSQEFTKEETLSVQVNTLKQIMICDRAGSVTIKVNPDIENIEVIANKKVMALDQNAGNQKLQTLRAELLPPPAESEDGTLACASKGSTSANEQNNDATEVATTPTETAGQQATITDRLMVRAVFPEKNEPTNAIDLTITLPQSVLPPGGPTMLVGIEAPNGDIELEGVSGIFTVMGTIQGDLKVTRAILAHGSKLTTNGKLTFNGGLLPSSDPDEESYFSLSSASDMTIVLPAAANIKLDIYTNHGKIQSDFPLRNDKIEQNGDFMGYNGPLNVEAGEPLKAQLNLHVGLGNIVIQRTDTPLQIN